MSRIGKLARAAIPRREGAESTPDIEPRIVWIFGSPRSGSTWLLNLLTEITGGLPINEPLIGAHLGLAVSDYIGLPVSDSPLVIDALADKRPYFFSRRSEKAWRPALRDLVIRRFEFEARRHERQTGRFPRVLIVKEPWGSVAAPVLARALRRSRLLFLVRDGRDVVHSLVDGVADGWLTESLGVRAADASSRRAFVAESARRWVRSMNAVEAAFDAHKPKRRLRLTYESLREQPDVEVERIIRWLRLDVGSVPEAVRAAEFSTIPEDGRGPSRFYRAATPGLWRHQLDEEEQAVMESIMGPTLVRLGYE